MQGKLVFPSRLGCAAGGFLAFQTVALQYSRQIMKWPEMISLMGAGLREFFSVTAGLRPYRHGLPLRRNTGEGPFPSACLRQDFD